MVPLADSRIVQKFVKQVTIPVDTEVVGGTLVGLPDFSLSRIGVPVCSRPEFMSTAVGINIARAGRVETYALPIKQALDFARKNIKK